jgi:hypothetical protein
MSAPATEALGASASRSIGSAGVGETECELGVCCGDEVGVVACGDDGGAVLSCGGLEQRQRAASPGPSESTRWPATTRAM